MAEAGDGGGSPRADRRFRAGRPTPPARHRRVGGTIWRHSCGRAGELAKGRDLGWSAGLGSSIFRRTVVLRIISGPFAELSASLKPKRLIFDASRSAPPHLQQGSSSVQSIVWIWGWRSGLRRRAIAAPMPSSIVWI
jgi:hypothetical protein